MILLVNPIQLTRTERLALIEKQVVEVEAHGYGTVLVTVNNHQITDSSIMKALRFGNCLHENYLVA